KLLHAYSKGYTGANEFRDLVNQISDKNIMRDLIESFF
ncbi:MAG: tRNA dihydrouridine synthase DusB, partial [Aliarcobacter cryaerophilus]